MDLKSLILLVILIFLFLSIYLKGVYHWNYLRKHDSTLKRYKSLKEFSDSKNMRIPSDFWDYVNVYTILWLPVFKVKLIYDGDRKDSRMIAIFSALYILLFILLILIVNDIIRIPLIKVF